ncbi:MAG: hypothetical protein P8M49_08215 [Thalassotalea sp.]|nr:hypothetical protein [Thalassotalea sp.]MDG2393482.1 hypothetical protein [Thalassotalea sp.]
MNITSIALIAEIVGGFAVLFTLIYLIFELKENTRTLKAKATTASIIGWSDWNYTMSQHKDKKIFTKSLDHNRVWDDFSLEDKSSLDYLGRCIVQRFMASFFQFQVGIMDEESWRQQITYCHSFLSIPVWKVWWEGESSQPIYNNLFIETVNSAHKVKLTIGGQFQK